MDFIIKILKSKTININALVVAIFAMLSAVGVQIPEEMSTTIVAIVMGVVNILLRFVTKDAIADK
jgi:uncharacterized membrane protein YvlD (DUF360 family)